MKKTEEGAGVRAVLSNGNKTQDTLAFVCAENIHYCRC